MKNQNSSAPFHHFHLARLAAVVLGLLWLAAVPARVQAATATPPNLMSYQGYLADANGAPLGNSAPANYDIIFRIYKVEAGGTPLWAEQQTVTIDKGNFSVRLGLGSAAGSEPRPELGTIFDSDDASDRLIGLTVKGLGGVDLEIHPRLRLLPSPYAFFATVAVKAKTADVATTLASTGPSLDLFGGTGGTLGTRTGGDKRVLDWTSNGRVGINTATPEVPLDVRGSQRITRDFIFFARTGNTPWTGHAGLADTTPYSILAESRIGAVEFNAFSDRRIKDIAGVSDAQKDLALVRRLQVTDYRMKDRVSLGNSVRKGFIAQEVEQVLPAAVTKARRFVPDLYAPATGVEFDAATGRLTVQLAKDHGLRAGDRVRLMVADTQRELEVVAAPDARRFVVVSAVAPAAAVFVWGREVADFHSLDYDQIYAAGIGAIQELARRVESLEQREARVAELEKQAAQVSALAAELEQMKKLVQKLAGQAAGVQQATLNR